MPWDFPAMHFAAEYYNRSTFRLYPFLPLGKVDFFRAQETGDRIQETGDRSQESGDRIRKSDYGTRMRVKKNTGCLL
jgi:hypothetical protein